MKLRRGTPGKKNQKTDCKQSMNPAVWREYKKTAEEKVREVIKNPLQI